MFNLVFKEETGGLQGIAAGKLLKGPDKIMDWEGWTIQEDLKKLVTQTLRLSPDVRFLKRNVAHGDRLHNVGWRSLADLFKYPGQPVAPLPPIMRKPMINRPRDLAPAWMDFIYANTEGSDPYMESPIGRQRENMMDIMDGRSVQSPFGSPPLRESFSGEEAGFERGEVETDMF